MAGVSLSLLSPFYPSEALSKGVSVSQSGLVMGMAFIATIVFTPFCGKYIHTLGARKFLVLGACVCGVGNLTFGFLNKVNGSSAFFWSSLLIRIVVAAGESAMTPAAYALAGQQVHRKDQGKAISLAESCFGAGTIFGPSLGGFLYEAGGFQTPFLVAGLSLLSLAGICALLLEDKSDLYTDLDNNQIVSWKQILLCPGVLISCFGLIFAGSSWSWYAATLEPFLQAKYSLSSSQTGLCFTAFGAAYTIFNPILGYYSDKGMDGLLALVAGNTIIALAFLFLGPIPQLSMLSGHLWLTVASIGVQGFGSAFAYLGSLLYMMKSARDSGLPDTEQVSSMVSSLWVVSDCFGGYIGSTLGSVAYDKIGFEMGTLVETGVLALVTIIISIFYFVNHSSCCSNGGSNDQDLEGSLDESEEETETRQAENTNLINKEHKYYGS